MDIKVFKGVRHYKGLSQSGFSEFLGVSESTVAMIEAGQRDITDKIKSKLALKFEFDADFMEYMDRMKKL